MLTATTRQNRVKMLGHFSAHIAPLELTAVLDDIPLLNDLLVGFGRAWYERGGARLFFAETILAVADLRRSTLRWALTSAWDLDRVWQAVEPVEHRLAIPGVLVQAFCALALAWGWPQVAVLLAMGFSMFLRPHEFLQAQRRHLLLPGDLLRCQLQMWLRIPEPKSRFRGARSQQSRCDEAWFVLNGL